MTATLRTAVLAGFLALVPMGALACGGTVGGTHTGEVTSLDVPAGTFTVRDAETGKPIDFVTTDRILASLSPGKSVRVDYEEAEDGKLKAYFVQ